MSTLYVLSAWVALLIIFVLLWVIRAMRKRHSREVINLIDDATTSRDKLSEAKRELSLLHRVHLTDNVMVERLLRSLETDKEARLQMAILLSKCQTLARVGYEQCHQWLAQMTESNYQIARESLRQLYNLQTEPDAGKPTNPGTAGNGGTAGGKAS